MNDPLLSALVFFLSCLSLLRRLLALLDLSIHRSLFLFLTLLLAASPPPPHAAGHTNTLRNGHPSPCRTHITFTHHEAPQETHPFVDHPRRMSARPLPLRLACLCHLPFLILCIPRSPFILSPSLIPPSIPPLLPSPTQPALRNHRNTRFTASRQTSNQSSPLQATNQSACPSAGPFHTFTSTHSSFTLHTLPYPAIACPSLIARQTRPSLLTNSAAHRTDPSSGPIQHHTALISIYPEHWGQQLSGAHSKHHFHTGASRDPDRSSPALLPS